MTHFVQTVCKSIRIRGV